MLEWLYTVILNNKAMLEWLYRVDDTSDVYSLYRVAHSDLCICNYKHRMYDCNVKPKGNGSDVAGVAALVRVRSVWVGGYVGRPFAALAPRLLLFHAFLNGRNWRFWGATVPGPSQCPYPCHPSCL